MPLEYLFDQPAQFRTPINVGHASWVLDGRCPVL